MQENLARSDEMNTRGSCVGGGVGVVFTAGEERFTRPVCARRFDLASGNGADRITRRGRLATGVTVPYLEQGDPQAAAVLLLHVGRIVGLFRPPFARDATDAPCIRDGSARPW